jgi:hypothetical protein
MSSDRAEIDNDFDEKKVIQDSNSRDKGQPTPRFSLVVQNVAEAAPLG